MTSHPFVTRHWLFAMFLWALIGGTAHAGEASDAEKLLTGRGLKKQINTISLEEEGGLAKALKDLQTLQRKAFMAAKELGIAEQQEAQKKQAIRQMIEMRIKIGREVASKSLPINTYNQLVLQHSELGERIDAAREDETAQNVTKEARSKFNVLREEYVDTLLKLRTMADKINEKYEDLKIDEEVTAAVESLNKESTKQFALEASSGFKKALQTLQGLEEKVLSESIKMRHDHGNSYYLSVVFAGKHTQEMCVDTGASLICLPFAMAKAVGLEPPSNAETLRMQLADGSVIEGKAMIAPKVRVGKFTVENVECVIMPAELPNAAPLLGMSFLKNFSFKINSDTHELVMSKIDTPGAADKPSAKKENKKKAG